MSCTRPGRVWIGLVLVRPYEEPSMRVFEVIWKVFESSFRWDIAAWYAPSSDRVTEQNEEGCWQTPGELSVQSSKQNNHALMWKQDVSLPLWLSLGCFLELGKLPYLIWKRASRATCWYKIQDHCPTDRYFIIIFWELLGSTKKVTFIWLYFLSYASKIIISLIKQFKTHDVSTCLKEIVLLHSLCLYEHQSYSYSPSPRTLLWPRVFRPLCLLPSLLWLPRPLIEMWI